jgi:hypothetical protein
MPRHQTYALSLATRHVFPPMTPEGQCGTLWSQVKEQQVRFRDLKKGRCEMESLMLTIKFVMLYAVEVFVVATLGAAVIAGLVQMVGRWVRSEGAALADTLNS